MNDLIERLKEITAKKNCAATTKAAIAEAIEIIQSKTAPAVHEGQWLVQRDNTKAIITCTNCKSQSNDLAFAVFPYCPICGAYNGG